MSSTVARKTARLGMVLGAVVALYVAGRVLGLETFFHADRIRELVGQAGAFGPLAFMALFVAAVVAQVPGIVFVIAAPALFSFGTALGLCWLASILAVVANFELVRRMGGQPLAEAQRPWLQKLLSGLEANPVRTIALLRIITIMFPPVTGALALTSVSSRDHAIGSAVGMLPPIAMILVVAGYFIG